MNLLLLGVIIDACLLSFFAHCDFSKKRGDGNAIVDTGLLASIQREIPLLCISTANKV